MIHFELDEKQLLALFDILIVFENANFVYGNVHNFKEHLVNFGWTMQQYAAMSAEIQKALESAGLLRKAYNYVHQWPIESKIIKK